MVLMVCRMLNGGFWHALGGWVRFLLVFSLFTFHFEHFAISNQLRGLSLSLETSVCIGCFRQAAHVAKVGYFDTKKRADRHPGASPADFVSWTRSYYSEDLENDIPASENGDNQGTEFESETAANSTAAPNIDQAFLEYAWRFFIQEPDVHLRYGENGKSLTLAEAEATHDVIHDLDTAMAGDDHTVPIDPELNPAPTAPVTKTSPAVRIYASDVRIWQAVAGHEPDSDRVKALDFVVLSAIAACGAQGVLQHELPALTGQDKRSLPSRTDRLNKDGYVIKKNVVVIANAKLLHTSLNTLWRYPGEAIKRAANLEQEARTRFESRKKFRKRVAFRDENVDDEEGSKMDIDPVNDDLSVHAEDADPRGNDFGPDEVVPQWDIDRPIYSHMFDLVNRAGTEGITVIVSSSHSLRRCKSTV